MRRYLFSPVPGSDSAEYVVIMLWLLHSLEVTISEDAFARANGDWKKHFQVVNVEEVKQESKPDFGPTLQYFGIKKEDDLRKVALSAWAIGCLLWASMVIADFIQYLWK